MFTDTVKYLKSNIFENPRCEIMMLSYLLPFPHAYL